MLNDLLIINFRVCFLYIFAYPYLVRIVAVFVHLTVMIQIIRDLYNDIVQFKVLLIFLRNTA